MIRHLRCATVMLITTTLAAGAWCQESHVTVNVSVEPETVKIGDIITLTVEVAAPADVALTLPGEDADLGAAEVRSLATEERGDGETRIVALVYELQAFEVGECEITPPVIAYHDEQGEVVEVQPEATAVAVGSVLAEGAQEIKDIRGPKRLPLQLWHYAVIALIGLLLAALIAGAIWFLVRRAGRRATEEQAPALPPHAEALGALDELEQRELVAEGRLHAYYVELSYIGRRYIERRYLVEALECTTPMLARRMRRSPAVPELAESFLEMLLTADLAKFAKYHPEDRAADMDLHSTRKLVQLTREREEPEEPEEGPTTEVVGND